MVRNSRNYNFISTDKPMLDKRFERLIERR
jgi:hypothetical protein